MKVERIWAKEFRKRQRNEARKERVNLNWPIHAQRAVKVFTAFKEAAEKDGVVLLVEKPEFLNGPKSYGVTLIGESTVELRFMQRPTNQGIINRNLGDQKWDIETGARLAIHHSNVLGITEVFFCPPYVKGKTFIDPQDLLYTYTFNTDDLTEKWISRLVSKFLIFNRVESVFEKSSLLDRLWVRWMRFVDIRNRRGFLKSTQHIFTQWELIFLTFLAALPLWAFIKWLWKLLNPFPL